MSTVRARKRAIVDSFRSGSQRRVEGTEGVDLLMGEGSFVDPRTVQVNLEDGTQRMLRAGLIFINVGARPRKPDLPGLDEIPFLDSTSIMELDHVPAHLLILGGGYIGLEFGQMFRRFGSQVTIVQRRGQVLTREDPDVAEEVAGILRDEGIQVLLDSQAMSVEVVGDDRIALTVQSLEGEAILKGSHLLVAAGRVPNIDHLNLSAAGIELDERGNIRVNNRLETNVPGIYALGDVKGGPAFTHIAYDDFRVIRANLLEGGDATIDQRMVPYTVFIDPQLGRIGLSEQQARSQGRNVRVAKLPMEHVARALEVDETRGFMKALVDAETDQILGAAILGIEGGEVMTVLQMAMMGGVLYTAIRDGVFSHPTLSESLNNLFIALDG
jgi:pyruvate/2-oxoglutarate dehydrogenase complex dihydrolipoamide dehydrogenase (E3) component